MPETPKPRSELDSIDHLDFVPVCGCRHKRTREDCLNPAAVVVVFSGCGLHRTAYACTECLTVMFDSAPRNDGYAVRCSHALLRIARVESL